MQVGWRRPRSARRNYSVGILFKFDSLRNFSRLTIHANNYFPKKVYVFRSVVIEFLHEHNSSSITFEHQRDDQFEMARPIMIDLRNNVASQLKVHFFFDSSWVLVSEMTFDSFVVPIATPVRVHPQQHVSPILLLIGTLTIVMFLILTVIGILVRSLLKNSAKSKGCYLSPIHNQTDSSASTASSEMDASSAHHRYATIGSAHPYSYETTGSVVSPPYAKLLPTTTLLRSLPIHQTQHIEGVCGNSTYGTRRLFTFDMNQKQFIPGHSLHIRQRVENRHQILGGGEVDIGGPPRSDSFTRKLFPSRSVVVIYS